MSNPPSRRRVASALVLSMLALGPAGCGRSASAGPPVVPLAAPATAVTVDTVDTVGPAPVGVAELCPLADEAVLGDVTSWGEHLPALQAALPGVDVAAGVADLAIGYEATPRRLAFLDQVWDAVADGCDVPADVVACRSLIVMAQADPLGWTAREGDPAQVEVAYDLAIANLADLRDRTDDPELRHSLEAHLTVLVAVRQAVAEAGWGPAGFDALAPIEADLVALGTPEVVEPLAALERRCGLR